MKQSLVLALLIVAAVLLVACGRASIPEPTAPASDEGAVTDAVSLMDALRAAGATVEAGETITQAFFSVEGQVIRVNG